MSPRKKKIYLVVIAVGGVAMLVDRLVLPAPITGPDAVMGETVPIGAQPATVTNGGVPGTTAWAIPELPFPQGLSVYRAGTVFRDLFASPGSQWPRTSDHAAGEFGAARGGTSDRGTTAAAFAKHHTVSGVVIIASRKIAVVDGKWVRIGESIDGCIVTAIRENEAVFRCRDGDTSLEVIAPPGRQGG